MKSTVITATLAIALGLSFTAGAQMKNPAVPAPVMAKMAAPEKTEHKSMVSRMHLDARECLKLETNKAIHGCAEKFR